jgi:hypothetical protein
MRKFLLLLTVLLFSTINAYSEENKSNVLPKDCYAEYKISPSTFGCGFKKGIKKLMSKKDGSHNFLGKFFNAKSGSDLLK